MPKATVENETPRLSQPTVVSEPDSVRGQACILAGYNMMILYTALKSVPRDVVEAAILDDTPLWKIIVRIKLPLVRPAIVMLVFLNTIGALQLFTEPQILESFQQGAISVNYTPSYFI